ncbi:hypothetical protein [Ferrovum myxofaciens]|uniref:Uncharacterized protein n=1 Tax=Ferrovum myxofaciens TaxID=416213 RepID=A0A9E6MZ52_9PROT|nr:hypothetical protein [Ferrovum myxofaciens]QKE37348.1 MAG: hypothetical protein HO273_00260 [Ferrovum myxofaciens]QWY75004.1 MAG: hypothetical protein JVY19_00735 [Ferrovum myxofaciens]QWY77745.1 MAG: hypothetical protein JZL65_01265 [Ferrovum myxofaciens]
MAAKQAIPAKLPATIKPTKIIRTDQYTIGVAPVTQPEHRSEFWYVAIPGPSGNWITRSIVRVCHQNGRNLEAEVHAWAEQALAR